MLIGTCSCLPPVIFECMLLTHCPRLGARETGVYWQTPADCAGCCAGPVHANPHVTLMLLTTASSVQDASEVTWVEGSSASQVPEQSTAAAGARIESKSWCRRYAVTSANFGPDTVGAKSLNTVALKVGLIPQHLNSCGSTHTS